MGNQLEKQAAPQKYEDVVLKRTEKSYHNLYSPRDLHKEYIWKKWKFCNRDKAQQQLSKLHYKMNNPSNFMIAVQDVQFTKTSSQNFKIRAKVEFSEKTLKSLIEDRKASNRNFTLNQIWNFTTQICQIAKYTKQNNHQFPEQLGSYLLFGNTIKIKDCSLLPEIKSESEGGKPSVRNIISRIVVNLSLLLLQNGDVPIYEINRINLKYNVNLATFVYCLKEDLATEEVLKLCENLSQENKQLVYKSATMGPENKYHLTTCESNLGQNLFYPIKHKEYLSEHKERLIKCTSENILPPNSKRIQEMKPKNLCKLKLVFENEPKVQPKDKENKENINQNQNPNNSKKDEKVGLEIENHSFPKKFKQFKRVSTDASDINESKNFDSKNSSARNQAFIKMTGGSKCQLFSQDQNDELLQSIIESEQSIIIKDNESPLLSLDQQMDQIAQDFLKLENSFNTVEKQEIKSVMQFVYQRNSTIMELTQENEQSGHDKNEDSRIRNSPNDVSKFQIEEGEQQEKFVIEQYEGGSRYEGYLRNGLRNGFGKLYYEDGGSYEGAWKNGEIEGFGKLYYQSGDLAYQGYWLQGEFHGQGKIINERPEQIEGNFHYADFSQVGTAWTWYEGNFEHDEKSGKGTLMLSNGESLNSTWSKNNVEGFGIFKTIENKQVRGKWKNNILQLVYEQEIGQFDNIQIP